MRYINEFRDARIAAALANRIKLATQPERNYAFMEFCGGHTHAVFRYGIPDLLPENIRLLHGPGCPVCVLPVSRLDQAIDLVTEQAVTLFSYGDLLRVPAGKGRNLVKARANGADVRVLQSPAEAVAFARLHPDRQVVFLAIGFETTTPPTALSVLEAEKLGLRNFSILCNHVLTPSAIQAILDAPEIRGLGRVQVDGFIGPSHVSTIIGTQPYEYFSREYQRPVVIAGFEPLDILDAIAMLVLQVNEKRAEVENQFSRGVTREGNVRAQKLVADVFELRPQFQWRGLGAVAYSGLRLKGAYARFDAEQRYGLSEKPARENQACQCPAIIRGLKAPRECPLFGSACTPSVPMGACMVSSEGACAAWYRYRRHQWARQTQG